MCRYDHGIGWDEFLTLTLAQIEALEERRNFELRNERFNAALMTAAIYNVNRAADSPVISPFDFLPGFEPDEWEEQRNEIQRNLRILVLRLPDDVTTEQVQALRTRTIKRLQQQGIEDAENIVNDVLPQAEGK